MKDNLLNSIWNLKANIKLATQEMPTKVLLVSSTTKGEGKTSIAINLAFVAAQGGQKVLLIDANLRRPNLHRLLNLTNNAGLSDFLQDKKMLKDTILPTKVKLLDVIPSGSAPSNPLKILDSIKMVDLVKFIKQEYDLIIFDACAIEDGSDAMIVSAYVDKIIFVLASGYTSAQRVKNAIASLQKENGKILGIVLNKVKQVNLLSNWLEKYRP